MFSYEKLEAALKEKGISKTMLSEDLGLSSRTVAKIAKGEKLSKRSMQKIADYLDLPADDLVREVSDNMILQTLRDEKEMKLSGGLYHELQVRMTYSSNHMEGSKLSEEQTRLIFETNTIDIGDGIPVDDILETVHHFRAIDYVNNDITGMIEEAILKYETIRKEHSLSGRIAEAISNASESWRRKPDADKSHDDASEEDPYAVFMKVDEIESEEEQ